MVDHFICLAPIVAMVNDRPKRTAYRPQNCHTGEEVVEAGEGGGVGGGGGE